MWLKILLIFIFFNSNITLAFSEIINNYNPEIIDNNNKTIQYLNDTTFDFELCYIDASTKKNVLPLKKAGVGLARKIGADLAIQYSHSSSILCYTDADAILSNDYLKIIARYYDKYKHESG